MDEFKTDVAAEPQAIPLEIPEGPGPIADDEASTTAASPQRPKSRRRTVLIPEDLLEGARQGMTTREIAQILSARLDRPVSVQAVYARLRRLGLRRPRDLAYDTRSGEVVFTTAEYQRLDNYHRRRKAHIHTVLKAARAGDRDALTRLQDEYGLRLPLVEARISPPLPWMFQN